MIQFSVGSIQFSVSGGRFGKSPYKTLAILGSFWLILLAAGCRQPPPEAAQQQPIPITLNADGRTFNLTTEAATVRELLAEAGIELGELDEVSPPLFTPLQNEMEIAVVRVREDLEIVSESIPYERRFVRTDTMTADDPPQIVQPGKNGLEEVTIRIVYRDDLESERWEAQRVVVEEPQDELVMIGIGANRENVPFPGLLAYISSGGAVLLRGTTAVPEQLNTGGQLDGRVFALSPDGRQLLYTRAATDTTKFNNSLWLISTERSAKPRELGVENVLWAGWNPAAEEPQIAYTTARSSDQPPGWEANNDLWLGLIPADEKADFEPEQLIEAYPALNGWWGGNYAWSPDGRTIAYAYANEVGLIDTQAEDETDLRRQLVEFTPYNTNADWVWVPTLTWSPDGRFLAFTQHGGDDEQAMQFDSWVADTQSPLIAQFREQSGMWGHMRWSPNPDASQIAYLQTTNPLDSLRSNYTLWLMDSDGSNARQLYPPPGENSSFSRDANFMAWGPDGRFLAFIFDDDLFLLDLETNEVTRITQDDNRDAHPVWAAPAPRPDNDAITIPGTPTVTPDGRNRDRPGE
ncbi:MAG: DUF348 domain-containing protein [Chloroflexi bacterium]|nr:DUF348 domain-containing protein [Chloroflexota bacterium]